MTKWRIVILETDFPPRGENQEVCIGEVFASVRSLCKMVDKVLRSRSFHGIQVRSLDELFFELLAGNPWRGLPARSTISHALSHGYST
jgi:hypothetical protein